MRSEIVTIEPQVVQFGRDNIQTIKVINNTSSPIPNFFFCLYNTEKFTFSPDSFSLSPHQHRLITITLRLKSARSAVKEFAYLKSTEINRRITLLINSFQSPQSKSRIDEGLEDVNTFSSRGYNQIQTEAIQRIIKEKEAYIELLEKDRDVSRHINFRTQDSIEKVGLFKRQAQQLQMKLILTQNQKQSILKENMALHNKFQEYRKYCEVDLKNYQKIKAQFNEKNEELTKLHEEIHYLQNQGDQFIKKLQQKQSRIRELEILSKKTTQEQRRQAQKKINLLQNRFDEQKKVHSQNLRATEQRIRDLQHRLQSSQKHKLRSSQLQRQLKRKEEQIKNLLMSVQSQRGSLRQLQGEKKKLMRFEVLNESMTEKNTQLTSRLKELQKVNYNLKEELFVYRSKLAQGDASTDKMSQYLQIALESCKSENDALKRTKKQLEKSLDEFMVINRQSHDNNKSLSEQLSKYKEQTNLLLEIKDNLQRRIQQLKQQNHFNLMKIKTENIELLQKLSVGETAKRQERLGRLQDELIHKARQLERYKIDLQETSRKYDQCKEQNAALTEKVKKYRKETKKQIRNLNDTAISKINRDQQQKKLMADKIKELEQVIVNLNCEKTKHGDHRGRSASGKRTVQQQNHLRKQRASSRIIGIKDQRKEIQSNKAYSQTQHQDQIFSQLGQLRQLNNYIRNQQERFNRILDLQPQVQFDQTSIKGETRPVFRAIKFFKKIQNRVRDLRGQSEISNVKQVQFLKGRLQQLQSLKQQKDITSNVNLSKTRQQCSELLQYVRQQMKSQYKKLNDHIRLCQQKYDLLKKKIYEEYRTKIIDVLNKKDKTTISQIQTTLERFIDGMSNLSHKEAILHKEVKLKQNARKQNVELKQKVNSLNHLLQSKKGYCSREPMKVLYNQTEIEWHESLKRQAQFLTLSAQYQRIKEEFDFLEEQLSQSKQNYTRLERQIDDKSNQILRLKRYQIQIQTNYQNQVQKQYEIIEQNKKRIMQMAKSGKQTSKSSHKQKEYSHLKDNLQKQKDIIKVLRQKEKMLEEILQESHRGEEKQRKKVNEENRVIQTMRDLRDNNRQLRAQNGKLKEKVTKIEDQLQKKNLYLKNLKGDIEENRIRVQRKDELQSDKLKEEVKRLTQETRKVRDELEKAKKKRQKEVSQYKNEIDRLNNENLINVKSLESIVRALMDNLRDIYGRLRLLIKKRKSKDIEDHHAIFDTSRSVNIDGLKISDAFGVALEIVQAF